MVIDSLGYVLVVHRWRHRLQVYGRVDYDQDSACTLFRNPGLRRTVGLGGDSSIQDVGDFVVGLPEAFRDHPKALSFAPQTLTTDY